VGGAVVPAAIDAGAFSRTGGASGRTSSRAGVAGAAGRARCVSGVITASSSAAAAAQVQTGTRRGRCAGRRERTRAGNASK
jgi:hypothetical protein